MRFASFLLAICSGAALTSAQATTEYVDDAAFQNAMLGTTNSFRAMHNASALQWHPDLVNYAYQYSQRCNFAHSGAIYGENLAAGYQSPTAAVNAWGAEQSSYDYNAGQFSAAAGHFTQLVWKSSTYVGCGRTYCNAGGAGGKGNAPGWYIVCEYYPPGNVQGQFKTNVYATS
ncbi:PR-1-like protein [Dothidotthia symphoricarpi CBS 119687]|uniref:PR-1-like protein n=1 Tax=Dothidotthia symphoricarpi CBS 119687 TaxID=1392245 RepID=A0A6A6ACX0_9PLEO|nr:PR-1-like protein [Dothidotthia symphoricarpi CBS 119687]KAF2128717.1 PR-1-like protein [Dothidotthia symphoricarpi CBS 119687]